MRSPSHSAPHWFGVPSVGAMALMTFLAAFIRTVGAILSGVVAVLIALADGGPGPLSPPWLAS